MIYPDDIEEKLGFDIIRKRLSDFCYSELGRNLIEEISFETNLELINQELIRVSEFKELIDTGDIPDFGSAINILLFLSKSEIKDNWLSAKELFDICSSITSALVLSNFMSGTDNEYPALVSLVPEIGYLSNLEGVLIKSVENEGVILSSASQELKAIRDKIIFEEGVLRKTLNSIFRKAKEDGIVPDGASIGVRDGRMVIPIIASSKRQIQGFVHDESASGNTVFLEPVTALSSNNRIRELQLMESREIRKILIDLTNKVDANRYYLVRANDFLANIDSLWARAKLAKLLNASKPEISNSEMSLKELRHPLLVLSYLNNEKEVIGQDINLDSSSRIILISGPNAGGKSVALKSVGLNQFMLQSGILPCCSPDSQFKIFGDLFIDIGDEQSIDNDLSTYSSHLKNMGVMLSESKKSSFVFIDEFGSGTDPAFGGAIAEAILSKLVDRNCFGIITTHFGNLKVFADKTPGVVNAAMIFDIDRLVPLYQLDIGRPGSSFSLEVALKSGIPTDVIEIAEADIGVNQIDVERLLGKLETEKQQLAEQTIELAKRDKALSRLKIEYEELKQKLEEGKKDIINRAKEEAEEILLKTNREIEKTIRHIKENRAEKKETNRVRKSLKAFSEKVTTKPELSKKVLVHTDTTPLSKGDQALLIEKEVVVNIVEIKGKNAKVLIGELQSVIALKKLRKISRGKAKEVAKGVKPSTVAHNVNEKMKNFSSSIDLRGTRASELIPKLQYYLDEAIMLDQQRLKVIHGKGNGVLRQLVRDELKQWNQIDSFDSEHIEQGGDGATIIILK